MTNNNTDGQPDFELIALSRAYFERLQTGEAGGGFITPLTVQGVDTNIVFFVAEIADSDHDVLGQIELMLELDSTRTALHAAVLLDNISCGLGSEMMRDECDLLMKRADQVTRSML